MPAVLPEPPCGALPPVAGDPAVIDDVPAVLEPVPPVPPVAPMSLQAKDAMDASGTTEAAKGMKKRREIIISLRMVKPRQTRKSEPL